MATEDEEEQYRQLPRGVPTLTYARLLDPSPTADSAGGGLGGQDDLEVDGDFVSVKEHGQALARFPVAHVFPKGMSDQVSFAYYFIHIVPIYATYTLTTLSCSYYPCDSVLFFALTHGLN